MNSDDEFDDLDLDKLPGIYDDNFQNNELEYLKEDQIQIFPNITEKPIYPSQTKNIINQQINNANNLNKKEEEIFTFKNINNKKGKIKKINNEYNNNKSPIINYIHKRIEEDKINANIMSFEELLKKNKSKSKNKKLSDLKDKKDNKNRIKIDFTRKLYQNKKIFGNEKEHNEGKMINIKQNKRNEIINNLPHNKSEISMRTKKIYKQNNMVGKNKNNEKEKILYNYFKLKNPSKKKSNIILNYKNKEIILNFENQKEQNKNKSFITEDNSRDTSLIMNKSSRTMKSKNNKKKKINIMNEIEDKIKIILKKDNSKHNITKLHPNIENELSNFDKSKFEKYNTEQMRYDLVKDYSFIHAKKDDDFLNRMEFDFVKRKNKEKKKKIRINTN